MKFIDKFLDHTTMYRLLLYYLAVILGAAMLLGALGYLPFSPVAIAVSTSYLLLVCWITNRVFAYVWQAPHNPESSLITALILALIITPPASVQSFVFLSAAAGLAISSKYILAIRRQHIFNPAAVAVALTALGAHQSASWWVGNARLLPFVLLGGLLLTRKIQRGQMVTVFILTATLVTTVLASLHGAHAFGTISNTVLHSSLFFMAFVMLTEPLTSPSRLRQQRWYGTLAGALFSPQIHLFGIYSTPELVLVISNAFSYIISPKVKLIPKLTQKVSWGPAVKDFVFTPEHKFKYKPGQYMEWTLPHDQPDNRGSRRYFTLASSPTESTLRLGVKFYEKSSSFKQAMWAMGRQTPIAAGQLGGDFTMPKDSSRKLVFIAGGIGITPFRSMLKYLVDVGDKRSVTLLYGESDPANLAYHDVLGEARQNIGAKIVYCLTGAAAPKPGLPGHVRPGQITQRLITEEVPDYAERLFYISGPQPMVTATRDNLQALGVPDHNIKTDFFPGYA
ncbi:MAG TPA: RnfABCDGE type electron transport complex subunit D [Candidatus Dormibacteraeota bacterium]|nr:RnfABCDGE type electron transport complex subunit D [Candidatus Dormibacteraeota bacterium]